MKLNQLFQSLTTSKIYLVIVYIAHFLVTIILVCYNLFTSVSARLFWELIDTYYVHGLRLPIENTVVKTLFLF